MSDIAFGALVGVGALLLIWFVVLLFRRRARARSSFCPTCGRTIKSGAPCPFCGWTAEFPLAGSPRSDESPTLVETPTQVAETQLMAVEKTQVVEPPVTGFFLVDKGPGAGTRLPLGKTPSTLGREPECDLCLADPSVSRRHAEVSIREGKVYIADLKSTNGTMVNGQRLASPHNLQDGDRVQLGEVVLIFQSAATSMAEGGKGLVP